MNSSVMGARGFWKRVSRQACRNLEPTLAETNVTYALAGHSLPLRNALDVASGESARTSRAGRYALRVSTRLCAAAPPICLAGGQFKLAGARPSWGSVDALYIN